MQVKVKIPILIIIINFFFFAFPISVISFDYVIDNFTFYPVPNIPRPLKGVQFTDPNFHTNITRITNSLTEIPNSTAGNYAQSGYPKHDIENADGTRLIIQTYGGSGWAIYNANPPYNFIQWIPSSLIGWGSGIDARWDKQDPDILYYFYEKKIMKYRVSTNKATILHDFRAEYPGEYANNPYCSITMMEEGDSSDDSRYWAFILHCRDYNLPDPWGPDAYKGILVYDKDLYGKDNGKIISTLKRDDPKWRLGTFASMSPSGKYVWIGDHHYIYPRDFSSGPRDLGICCHADMAISAEGREVVFGFALKDGMWSKGYWATMVDIETGELTYLAGPIGSPEWHFSGNSHDKPGWGLVSTYGPSYPGVETQWYQHSAFMVELTKRKNPPPRVWRIANTRTVLKSYPDASFAKLNKKGTKIFFGSAWGQSIKDPGAQYDVYQINLPSTWYQDLMGKSKF